MAVSGAYAGEAHSGVRRPLLLAAIGSMLVILVGALWLAEPSAYPFGPGDRFADMSLLGGAESGLSGWLAISVGIAGVLAAGRLAYVDKRPLRGLLAVAVGQAIVLGLLAPDIQILILSAYLLAFAVPPVLLGSKIRSWLRHPRARWAVMLVAGGVVAVGVGSGVLRAETIVDLGTNMGQGFATLGARPLYLVLALAVGMSWVGVVAAYVREVGPGRVATAGRAWVARWGVVATWVAALSPLPYVLTRLTWLTPWPMFAPDDLDHTPAMRLMGIMLGLVAESCLWLTLGIIRPRGEIFPRWVPFVGGRPVPVLAAVVPGLAGAVLLTIAGRSIVQQSLFSSAADESTYWMVLLMPLWLWGPALGVATLAYWLRRRAASYA